MIVFGALRRSALPVMLLALAPAPARAQQAEPEPHAGAEGAPRQRVRSRPGPELSLTLGWGDPHGQRQQDADLARVVVGHVPVQAALGYRTGFGLLASAEARYGVVIGRDCATECSGSLVRVGAALEYHFTPEDRVDHYVGLGAGYEWLALDIGTSTLRYRGPEWLELRFGEEFPLGPLGIGPVLSLALGQYTHQKADVPPVPAFEGPIEERRIHVWLVLGLRVSHGWR